MQTHQGSLMLAQCQALCCEGESAVSRTGSLPLKSNLEGRQPTSPVVWVDSLSAPGSRVWVSCSPHINLVRSLRQKTIIH